MMTPNWRSVLPDLKSSADKITCQLLDSSTVISLKANTTVFHQGDACNNYLIILTGKIKIYTRAENGREILLYRLFQGDSCVITTSCLFGNKNYPAAALAETEVSALAIPASQFNAVLKISETFREMVFSAFSSHLTDLITLVEEVAFGKIDARLAKHLLKQCDKNKLLTSTHQIIATELGTAREVISRQLKDMESKGHININRGNIKINDVSALQDISSG